MAQILILEDNEKLRILMKTALEESSYNVTVASNGQKGIELISSDNSFDLIILDMFMPLVDGVEVLTILRQQDSRTPILAISGGFKSLSAHNFLGIANKLGATATLEKPFDLTKLISIVSNLLAGT